MCLAIINLSSAYTRTNQEKEQSLRRGLAYLLKYCSIKNDEIEVQYNIGRALHLMGLNSLAYEMYMKIVDMPNEVLSEN